jgi:hypothetical protein
MGEEVTNIKSKQKAHKLEPDHIVFQPGEMGAILELTVKRKDGTVRERRVRKAESFVRQFLDLLMMQAAMANEMSWHQIRDTGNVLRAIAFSGLTFATDAAANDDIYGVMVGTGNTAPTINDYALETRIDDGVGAGELQYGGVTYGLPTSSATESHFTITRDFSNASGGAITVEEIGVYVKAMAAWIIQSNDRTSGAPDLVFMTIRDVVGGGITIPDGETLTVNYRLQATA